MCAPRRWLLGGGASGQVCGNRAARNWPQGAPRARQPARIVDSPPAHRVDVGRGATAQAEILGPAGQRRHSPRPGRRASTPRRCRSPHAQLPWRRTSLAVEPRQDHVDELADALRPRRADPPGPPHRRPARRRCGAPASPSPVGGARRPAVRGCGPKPHTGVSGGQLRKRVEQRYQARLVQPRRPSGSVRSLGLSDATGALRRSRTTVRGPAPDLADVAGQRARRPSPGRRRRQQSRGPVRDTAEIEGRRPPAASERSSQSSAARVSVNHV